MAARQCIIHRRRGMQKSDAPAISLFPRLSLLRPSLSVDRVPILRLIRPQAAPHPLFPAVQRARSPNLSALRRPRCQPLLRSLAHSTKASTHQTSTIGPVYPPTYPHPTLSTAWALQLRPRPLPRAERTFYRFRFGFSFHSESLCSLAGVDLRPCRSLTLLHLALSLS